MGSDSCPERVTPFGWLARVGSTPHALGDMSKGLAIVVSIVLLVVSSALAECGSVGHVTRSGDVHTTL